MTTLPPDAEDPAFEDSGFEDSGFEEPPFTWAESDLEAALAVLGRAAVPPTEALVLTDEEIVALDGLQHSQVVPTPWFDTQEVEPNVLAAIALRGLTARRLVRLNHLEDDDGVATGQVMLSATEEITGVLMLRRTAQDVVRLERRSASGSRWVYAYAHQGRGVLLEDIDPDGLHLFGVTTPEGARDYLGSVANPYDAEGVAGESEWYSEAEFEALENVPAPFAGAETAALVTGFTHGSEDVRTTVLYAGPERLGMLVSDEAGGAYEARGITREEALAVFDGLLVQPAD